MQATYACHADDDGATPPPSPAPGPSYPPTMAADPTHERFLREFEAAGPALLAWARLRLRPELRTAFEPEDLIQEVGCRALAGAASYDPQRASFRQWLFGIANRVLLEALRDLARTPSRAPRLAVTDRSGLTDAVAAITSVTSRVARDEVVRAFLERADRLEPEDRLLLLHRGVEQRPHPQVAELLGVAEDTVRKRWQRLCERMREDPVFESLAVG